MKRAEYASQLWSTASAAPCQEWEIVMLFYASLHATGSLMYGDATGQKHTRHQLDLTTQHPAIAVEYEKLRQLSEQARYRPEKHPLNPELARRLAEVICRHCGVCA